jgi:hypothetical protein
MEPVHLKCALLQSMYVVEGLMVLHYLPLLEDREHGDTRPRPGASRPLLLRGGLQALGLT